MAPFSPLLAAALLASAAVQPARGGTWTRYADPLLATRGGGGFGGWGCQARSPGAMAPTPFLRRGPDTTRVDALLGEAWSKLNRHAGYFGSDSHIRAFSHTHVQGAGDADLGTVGVMVARADAAAVMRAANPKYIPREWMLVAAYTAAEAGDDAPVRELHELFRRPYDEQPDFEARFYRRADARAAATGGVGFMT